MGQDNAQEHGTDGSPTDGGPTEAPTDGDRAHTLAVFASGRLVDTGRAVGALRFDPDDAGRPLADGRVVSGWSAFAGDETEEELTDAERMRLPSLAWLVERDPSVALVTAGHDASTGYWVRGGEDAHGLPVWERLLP